MVRKMRKVTIMMTVSSPTSLLFAPARAVGRAKATARALRANIENMIPDIPSTNLRFARVNRFAGSGGVSTVAAANVAGGIADNV